MAKKFKLSPEQDTAANPTENVWVQANAGTGKTSVLVQRLLRTLFRTDNIDDCGILCLTYTKAAAGEMRNRILRELQKWAMADDTELVDLLDGVALNHPATADDIAHARTVFFKYIDTPELLKIKTIHGFCEEILHRFPIEAGISPSWSLVSDDTQRVLLQDAFSQLINSSNNTRVNDAFTYLLGRIDEYKIDDLMSILVERYRDFFQITNIDNYRKYFIDTTKYFLNLDTPAQTEIDTPRLQKIIDMCNTDINSSKKPAQYLINIINLTKQYIDKTIDFEKYKTAYLTDSDTKRAVVAKKDYLVQELERVYSVNQYNLATQTFNDTVAVFDLSAAFAQKYAEIKSQHNLLDFEDLILYTKKLFSAPDVMGWVLSQLNVRLAQILVDEAQDTSPTQWDILRLLSGDFFTDGNSADNPHTMFVVGDTKQSIYGFQGADPRAFDNSRTEISRQIQQNMRQIQEVPLVQSFRSMPQILYTVDAVFNDSEIKEKTGFINNSHKWVKSDPNAFVEIHKLIDSKTDEIDIKQYVSTIAKKIQFILTTGNFVPSDIMVLVQKREPLTPLLVKELKRLNIPVAGSDRITLPDFPAIRDLLNLVRFCINQSDDYSLCCVLKSPIFRLTERDIFNICKTKNDTNFANKAQNTDVAPVTVFDVLRTSNPDIYERLSVIIKNADTMGPYSFFTNILNTNNTRESMVAALGSQIIDPLEEFLTICMAYERTQSGTLHKFLKWFITGGSVIKRDMDAASGVRIVTVHSSKGLEAPVIFLIDTVRIPKNDTVFPITPEMQPSHLRTMGEQFPTPWIWAPKRDNCEPRIIAEQSLNKSRIAEYYRLLYVAMTRAITRLYIYGFAQKNRPATDLSWHTQLWRVLNSDNHAIKTPDTIRIENVE